MKAAHVVGRFYSRLNEHRYYQRLFEAAAMYWYNIQSDPQDAREVNVAGEAAGWNTGRIQSPVLGVGQ